MARQTGSDRSLVLSYLELRRAIGIIGIALPFVLACGEMLLVRTFKIQSSISAYYYTGMRNVFVGSLCAIGVFLMSYRGYEYVDELAGKLASAFAIGVALFPTTPEGTATCLQKVIGAIHLTSAALLFLTLAYFSYFLFTKTDHSPGKTPTRRKLQRNWVYRICGIAMVASVAAVAILGFLPSDLPVKQRDPVFWLESVAIVAFGISWLTKGAAIALLNDEP